MERYNVNLLDNSYTVEIPFADHIQLLDVVGDAIHKYNSKVDDINSFTNNLSTFVKNGELTQEVADKLKQGNEYQVEELNKKINVALRFLDSVEGI